MKILRLFLVCGQFKGKYERNESEKKKQNERKSEKKIYLKLISKLFVYIILN